MSLELHPQPRGYAPRDWSSAMSSADPEAKCSWDAGHGCWRRGDGAAREKVANPERTAERAERAQERAELADAERLKVQPWSGSCRRCERRCATSTGP